MLKIVTSTSSQEFPQSFMFSDVPVLLFMFSLNFPVMFVLLIIMIHQHCYKNLVYLSISYIQFIDI